MKVPGVPFVQGRNWSVDSDGRKYGIAIHNTSNTASASAEASYATRRTDSVSSHFYVDGTQVIQSLDTSVKAWHAGSAQGNDNAVAFELVGTNDKSRAWWLANICWDKFGAVLAQLCKVYGIQVRRASVSEMVSNPKVKALYGHDDMRRAWGGTTHTDPGPNFPWDKLFDAVNAALNPPAPAPAVTTTTITKETPTMLGIQIKGDPTIYLSWGPDRGCVALNSMDELPKSIDVITVKDAARLKELGGPLLTPAS